MTDDKADQAGEDADTMSVDTEAATPVGDEVQTQEDQDPEDTGDDAAADDPGDGQQSPDNPRRMDVRRLIAYGLLPALALVLAGVAGYAKWQESSMRAAQLARIESVAAAKDGTVAMLSYQPDTAERDLGAARDRMTGTFKDSYTQLTNDVVIPGAKQRHISATANVPAAASVSATGNHAVVLVFVNQTTVVGTDPPSSTASSVRITLDKIGDRWLMSAFDPV